MRFRKKPVEIEAMQFDGSQECAFRIESKLEMSLSDWSLSSHSMIIHTLEGDMTADKGDWIIKGVKGEFYPCKPDIFDLTYEEVDTDIQLCPVCGEEMESLGDCLWRCPNFPHDEEG